MTLAWPYDIIEELLGVLASVNSSTELVPVYTKNLHQVIQIYSKRNDYFYSRCMCGR